VPSFSQWQTTRQYPQGDAPFDATIAGGPAPFWHNMLDERRSGWHQTPEATYPDGYLGTLNARRSDRLMQNLIDRQRSRPYSRGVHKGERIDGSDYFWPVEFGPDTGLMMEAAGLKFAPPGLGMEISGDPRFDMATIGPRGIPRGNTVARSPVADPNTRGALVANAPPWSTGRAQSGMPYAGYGRM
jgi:hypothetical protein